MLKVALSPDFAPMEFVDTAKEGQEQFVGFDVTLAKHIAEQLGMKLEIENMEFDSVIAAVNSGKADVAVAGLSVTPEREKNVSFTQGYTTTKQVIITRKD